MARRRLLVPLMHIQVLENFGKLRSLRMTDQADKNLVRTASCLTALVALFVEQSVGVACVCRHAAWFGFGGGGFKACGLAVVEL